eukprot:528034-Amphidinium_carterae.1
MTWTVPKTSFQTGSLALKQLLIIWDFRCETSSSNPHTPPTGRMSYSFGGLALGALCPLRPQTSPMFWQQ